MAKNKSSNLRSRRTLVDPPRDRPTVHTLKCDNSEERAEIQKQKERESKKNIRKLKVWKEEIM